MQRSLLAHTPRKLESKSQKDDSNGDSTPTRLKRSVSHTIPMISIPPLESKQEGQDEKKESVIETRKRTISSPTVYSPIKRNNSSTAGSISQINLDNLTKETKLEGSPFQSDFPISRTPTKYYYYFLFLFCNLTNNL